MSRLFRSEASRMSSWSILSKPVAKQFSTITLMTYGKWMLEAAGR